jgi:hypothetical protein
MRIVRIYRRCFDRIPAPESVDRLVEDVFTPAEIIAHFVQYLLRKDLVVSDD